MYSITNEYLNGQYMHNQYDHSMSAYAQQMSTQRNQIYVNQSLMLSNTVLVNPNFTRQVHINPNFANKSIKSSSNTVFVNPNVFNKGVPAKVLSSTTNTANSINIIKSASTTTAAKIGQSKKTIVSSKYSKINNCVISTTTRVNSVPTCSKSKAISRLASSYKVNNLMKNNINTKNDAIVKTKTKLIRIESAPTATIQVPITSMAKRNLTTLKPGTSSFNEKVWGESVSSQQRACKPKQIISRHKLVRNNLSLKNVVKTKYKLIRSSSATTLKALRNRQLRKLPTLNSPNRFKLDNRIGRQSCAIMRSIYKLTKKAYMMRLDPQNNIIKNTKFKLVRSAKMKRVEGSKKLEVAPRKNITLMKKFTKKNLVKINKKKLRKNNIPCEIYNRKGVCRGFAAGKCSKKHDPNQIQICIWFLQGICRDEKCTLSHKASPEKMPTCKFYLEGVCHKDNCPYLHVKLSKDAPVCGDFLNGYCAKAHQCDKRHQFLCPDFERDGKCSRKLCRYPHGKAVRQYKDTLLNVIARNRKSKPQRNANRKSNVAERKVDAAVNTKSTESKETGDSETNKRYYECSPGSNGEKIGEEVKSKETEQVEIVSIFDRPKLGSLPSFISL